MRVLGFAGNRRFLPHDDSPDERLVLEGAEWDIAVKGVADTAQSRQPQPGLPPTSGQ